MGVDGRQRIVRALGVDVVEEQTHAHAAVGCRQHLRQQRESGLVRMKNVVLHIQAAVGLPDERHACHERIGTLRDRVKSRLAGMRRQVACGGPAQARVLRAGECGGGRSCNLLGQRRAPGNDTNQNTGRDPDRESFHEPAIFAAGGALGILKNR